MAYELQFLVMADSRLALDELVLRLMEKLEGARTVRARSFDWADNWIAVWPNDDHDPEASSDPEQGFLHYRYRIEVSPLGKEATVDRQIRVAKELERVLESLGAGVAVCADFEELLGS